MTHRTRPGLSTVATLVSVAALAGGVLVGYFLLPKVAGPSTKPPADDTQLSTTPTPITALGRLQPAGGVISLSAPPGDQIVWLAKDLAPRARVKPDQELVRLKSAELRAKEVEVAEKQLAEGKAAEKAAKAAGLMRIKAAEAELEQAKANRKTDVDALQVKADFLAETVAVAAKQLNRVRRLKADDVRIAEEDLEKAELQVKQAKAEHAGAVAMVTKTDTTYAQSVVAGQAKVDAARADLEAELAKAPIASGGARVELARQMHALTTLRSPIEGNVLKLTGRVGQPTTLDPVVQVANLDEMTAVAEVYESDVGQLKGWMANGREVAATVSSPALGPAPLTGRARLEDVTGMVARNAVFALGPREDADRRVVEVVVRIDPQHAALAAGMVNLQVTVVFSPPK